MAVTVKAPPRDLRTLTCSKCGYVLEYRLPADTHQHYDDFDTLESGRCVQCPRSECKGHTKVPEPSDYIDI